MIGPDPAPVSVIGVGPGDLPSRRRRPAGGVAPVSVIGVGPGDPEWLTIQAARMLNAADVIFHAGSRDDAGFAFDVVRALLRPDQTTRGMALMMRRGPDDGSVGYERVADALAVESREGRQAVFLTEGDPMLYGTGSYVSDHLRVRHPDVPVEIVPGVTAISAAAARLGWPLAQKEEILTICPALYHADDIGAILDRGGAVCWLKAADVLPRLIEELRLRGRLDRAALVERIGRPDERTWLDLTAALETNLSYFSLVLVR